MDWLRKRVAKLKPLPSFAATEYSEDYDQIAKWSPLLCKGRSRDEVRHPRMEGIKRLGKAWGIAGTQPLSGSGRIITSDEEALEHLRHY